LLALEVAEESTETEIEEVKIMVNLEEIMPKGIMLEIIISKIIINGLTISLKETNQDNLLQEEIEAEIGVAIGTLELGVVIRVVIRVETEVDLELGATRFLSPIFM